MEANLSEFSESERRALLATVLVHDVGTPPFGHLFELLIKERYGWDHETAAHSILLGNSVPENSAHLIFEGRGVSFRRELRRSGIDGDLVRAIITKSHPLSNLLFGSLDFDNLDNVTRMAWALGIGFAPLETLALARVLTVAKQGELLLSADFLPDVERWLVTRRAVYDLLIFDEATVASQAVLAEAMQSALEAEELGPEDWSLTDEDCLSHLKKCNSVDQARLNRFWGVLPKLLLLVHFRGGTALDGMSRQEIYQILQSVLVSVGTSKGLSYLTRDRRTFSRRLGFKDPESGNQWTVGDDSASTIVYIFCDHHGVHRATGQALMQKLLAAFGLQFADVLRYSFGGAADRIDGQQTFDFSP